ncbi:hypothetical protein [Vampirovibrio sp.]|uniref:hypothetical protein n=1 Tax=Vampirovibrio sp. TaxID=2717857 RepID=UPI0035948719
MINRLIAAIDSGKPELTKEHIVECVIHLNSELNCFWRKSQGWAPIEAANLLSSARLDRQLSMSYNLRLFLNTVSEPIESEGRLILAYVALRSLVESTLKLYLTVWHSDYINCNDAPRARDGRVKNISDELGLEDLKVYLNKKGLLQTTPFQHAHGYPPISNFLAWLTRVQQRGNGIHPFKHREMGTFEDYYEDTARYLEFLAFIIANIPYPDDEIHRPRAFYKPYRSF